jgi:DNA polymerase I-like protein with 3'-5' exonuclease and polymerase domains/uracil-DNA glycosylase
MLKNSVICEKCPLRSCVEVSPAGAPDPDIVLVGGFPTGIDARTKAAFSSKHGYLLRRVAEDLRRELPKDEQPRLAWANAVRCVPPFDEKHHKYAVTAAIAQNCGAHLLAWLENSGAGVVVLFGEDAARAVGLKGTNFREMRGGVFQVDKFRAVVTYSTFEPHKRPGLLPVMTTDIRKAFRLAASAEHGQDVTAEVITDAREIPRVLEEIRTAADRRLEEKGKPLAVSLDTETTSLKPYLPGERIIAMSLSWKDGHGIAFPYRHREAGFGEEDIAGIDAALERLVNSPSVYLVAANGKFDAQWLRENAGLRVPAFQYDVLLAEHALDEDKKGNYSLKAQTRDYFPHLGRYEEELKELLAGKEKDASDRWNAAKQAHREEKDGAFLEWWLGLDEESRMACLGEWVGDGLLKLSETEGLSVVSRRKWKGEMVVPKKYAKAVAAMLRAVPEERLEGIALPASAVPDKPDEITYEDIEMPVLLRYAAVDAAATRMLVAEQVKGFREDERRIAATEKSLGRKLPTVPTYSAYRNIDIPLSECLAHMEYHGIRIDRDRAASYSGIIREKLAEIVDALYAEIGWKFNLSASSPDLGRILYDTMRLPVLKYTDTGEPSTDAETLKDLSDRHPLPFLERLLVYRKLDKCLNTYIGNWLATSALDGKVHCQFNQIGTATYRLSSSDPNLQNVPFALKEADLNLKALFLPDSDEYELYDLDIANAEMRVLTAYSRDEALIDAFRNGKDIHCLTGAGISRYSYEELRRLKDDKSTDQYKTRQVAKKVNFGTIYCMSAETLMKKLWSDMRIDESLDTCEAYLENFFRTYPGVKRYIDSTRAFVARYYYTFTYTGRRRRFALAAYSRTQTSRMARQAVNARIQTTSSDLVAYNLIDLQRWLLSVGGRALLTVHDSMPFQAPKGLTGVKEALDRIIVRNTEERAPWMPVAWTYDVAKGPNYGDTHTEVA